jgi:hypothetical protein
MFGRSRESQEIIIITSEALLTPTTTTTITIHNLVETFEYKDVIPSI